MPVKCLSGSTESSRLPPKRKRSDDRRSINGASVGGSHTTDASCAAPRTTNEMKKRRIEDTVCTGSDVDGGSDSDSNINTDDDHVNVEPGNNEEVPNAQIHGWMISPVEMEKISYTEVGVQVDEFPTEYGIWNYLLVRSGLGTRLPLVKARRKHRLD